MAGYGVMLPLKRNSKDGFSLIKDQVTLTKQNLKMLLLTSPGERIMDPFFGVGIRQLLFEPDSPHLSDEIRIRIMEQIKQYMNYIEVEDLFIKRGSESSNSNLISISLKYFITNFSISDNLELEFLFD